MRAFPASDDDANTVVVIITDAATRSNEDVVVIPQNAFFGHKFEKDGKWYYHVDEAKDGSWRFVNQ